MSLPPQPFAMSTPGSTPAAKKKGGKGLFLFFGCGCMVLFLLVAAGIIVGIGGFMSLAGDDESGGFIERLSDLKDLKDTADSATRATEIARKSESYEYSDVRKSLRKKLTEKDAKDHLAFTERVRKDPKVLAVQQDVEKLKELENADELSTLEKARILKGAATAGRGAIDALERWDELIREDGGYDVYFDRLVRISGITAAARHIAATHKIDDPSTNKVADLMLEERPKIRREFLAKEKEFQEAVEKAKGDRDIQQLAAAQTMAYYNPPFIAFARMPRSSFEQWRALPRSQRRQLLEITMPEEWTLANFLNAGVFSANAIIAAAELQALHEALEEK